jgi:DNA-binding CsgD family transcriptional regulator
MGMLLHSRALLAADTEAEELYRAGIERLERCLFVLPLGRALLRYGEWLRRQRRRRDAREQLRAAYDLLVSVDARAFAERARIELLATGEHVARRTVDTRDRLTPQEAQIASMASEGASNREIAERLFISRATVAYHLQKVFRKLGVTNRAGLANSLAERVDQGD